MKSYIDPIKTCLAGHQPDFGCSDISSLLEMLYYHYTEHNSAENQQIRNLFGRLEQCMNHLDLPERDGVEMIVSELCCAYEQAAFLEGMRVGARLIMELESVAD